MRIDRQRLWIYSRIYSLFSGTESHQWGTANVPTIADSVVDRKGVVARNAGDIGDTDIAQAVEDMVDDRRHEIWVPSYELPRRANAPSNGFVRYLHQAGVWVRHVGDREDCAGNRKRADDDVRQHGRVGGACSPNVQNKRASQ